jgi:RNA polymerase sigma-70 factor (ECF subfamily)
MPPDRSRINALMDRASAGDHDTFGALASAVQDELFRLALAHGLHREDAAEATQETLLRAYAGRRKWNRGADAMAWLCGILVNVARECHRLKWPRSMVWDDPGGPRAADGGRQATARDDDPGPEELRQLREAINRLPPRQREAIACRYLRGMSLRQTAEVMGCAEGTVKSAVSAALERLREILQKAP